MSIRQNSGKNKTSLVHPEQAHHRPSLLNGKYSHEHTIAAYRRADRTAFGKYPDSTPRRPGHVG